VWSKIAHQLTKKCWINWSS